MASSEKSNAMRSFQVKRNFENIFHFFNLCAALLLFSHSPLFPITLQTFSNFRTFLTPLFNNSFYAFLLLNTIILFLLALSNKTTNTHQFLNRSASRLTITVPQEQEQPATVESEVEFEFEVSSSVSPVSEETVAAVNETTTTTCCTTVAKVSEEKKKKCYRRVQSERRVVLALRRELKRFNTNASVNRQLQMQRRLRCVEQLSRDEFNRAVEEFIAKHKRMQWEEQVESQKTGYFAITP